MSVTDNKFTLDTKSIIVLTVAALVAVGSIGGAAAGVGSLGGLQMVTAQEEESKETAVRLEPSSATVNPGQTTTYDVVVQDPVATPNGSIAAYELTVWIEESQVASITDFSIVGDPGLADVNEDPSNSSVRVSVALANISGTDNVSIGTVTVRGQAPGNSDIGLSVNSLGDPEGNSYTVTETPGASITVESPGQPESDPADFEVSNLQAPSSAMQGDLIDVSADVENVGDSEGTQTVGFRIGSGSLESDDDFLTQEVTLESGETETVTFSDIDTSSRSPGDYTHGIFTANDSETATITIEERPETSVSLQPSTATVDTGETTTYDVVADSASEGVGAYNFTVSVADTSVASITDAEALANASTTDVSVASDGSSVEVVGAMADTSDTGSVTIGNVTVEGVDPGNSAVGLSVEALGTQAGDGYEVTDTSGASITVEAPGGDPGPSPDPGPADFGVSNLQAPSSATVGDSIDVSAEITNTGDSEGTQSVDFRLDQNDNDDLETNETLDSQNVTLGAGESTTVTFSDIDTSGLEPGEYTHGVATANETATATIELTAANEPPTADAGEDQTVVEEASVTLDASDSTDPDDDSLAYAWTQTDGPNVSLPDSSAADPSFTAPDVDEETTLTFEVEVSDGEGGTDTDEVTVTVLPAEEEAFFAVTSLDVPAEVQQGESVEVTGEITNTGDVEETQTVEVRIDFDRDGTPETVQSRSITLAGGESTSLTLTRTVPPAVSPGTYTGGLFTDDDSETATVTVVPPSQGPPEENEPPTADAGDDRTVSEESTVTLDASGSTDPDGDSLSYTWTQTDGPDVSLSDSSAADPSFTAPLVDDETTLTFEVEVSDGEGGTDTDAVTVTVEPVETAGAFFEVTALHVPDRAAQGESVEATGEITNTGDAEGTQTVEVRIDVDGDGTPETIRSRSITLSAGESYSMTATRTVPTDLEPGTYTGGLFTEDSSLTDTIEIVAAQPDERFTRDEIAQAKYGYDFDELSDETSREVEELYNRQPFADGAHPEDVKTRDEIAQERHDRDFDELSRETTVEIQSDFDAQFGDTGDDAEYTRDEIAQAKYGHDFDELSTETSGQVEELYNRQPFADGASPSEVQTREEIANQKYGMDLDELSRETRLEIEGTYHEQFAASTEGSEQSPE
ncbi:PKD domain-containing protein [Halobellus limi]|uniref:CARDB protein n=1 Tax=Halobellus limi TaxID=699433 RepID=A0A1H5SR22_9EURY|nr:CARDB domain-containing protein [Halobellus limi]QCC47509.1 hypothetical protein DV707_07455 [Halobellus limi]SEF53009.1 CARDB protein [Halobellus limi]